MPNDPNSPTTVDLRNLAFSLNKVYAQKIGAIPTPKALVIHFDGNLTRDELRERLTRGGFELFADCNGNTCARTAEVGNLHRELVKAERDIARLERQRRTEIVAHSPFEPPITREVPIDDPDDEGQREWEDACDREGREY